MIKHHLRFQLSVILGVFGLATQPYEYCSTVILYSPQHTPIRGQPVWYRPWTILPPVHSDGRRQRQVKGLYYSLWWCWWRVAGNSWAVAAAFPFTLLCKDEIGWGTCVYVCTTYAHMLKRKHIYTHMHLHKYLHMHIKTNIGMALHMPIYAHMYEYIHTHTFTTYAQTQAYTYACTYINALEYGHGSVPVNIHKYQTKI